MNAKTRTLFFGIALAACALPALAATWPGFTRGMGFGGWLTNYKRFNVLPEDRRLVITEGDLAHFDSYLTEADVARVARWGFDHVRVGFDQIVLEEKPGVWRERTFRRLDDFVGWCSKHRLNVVLNLHKAIGNYCDIQETKELLDDPALQARFIALWLEIERRYHAQPGLAFEILNEVRDVDPVKWNDLADRTIRALREKNPNRWIVVGPTCWNNPGHLASLKVWDDPKVVYTFHMYAPFLFTHQRGVLQVEPLARNDEVPYPGTAVVERALAPAVAWARAHPDRILWNGEFGTIRHMNPMSRVSYMRDVVSVCRREGMPWCVWNYLSTPNDGNRFSLVDDETRDFLSVPLRQACLGEDEAASRGELTFMAMNLWGAYFGNPVCERDLKQVAYVRRRMPDLVACQEAMPDFWSSRLFAELGKDYGIIRCKGKSEREYNPLLWRRERIDLIEGGTEIYAAKDNPEGSKGFAWGVFRDRATGRRFIAYSTHLMWSCPDFPKKVTAHMRVNNATELLDKVASLLKRYGDLPVVGGGDLNTTVAALEAGLETPLSLWRDRGYDDAQYVTPGASNWSSAHGDPHRDAAGDLRATIDPRSADSKLSLDHVHFTRRTVEPLSLLVDRAEQALEFSDHSPVLFTFRLKNAESPRPMPERGLCAHRGDRTAFPENTVPAFKSAAAKGAAMVEFDVWRCKTGELVILHDWTVDRTTTGTGAVERLSFDYLRSLDAGVKKDARFRGTKIPTFDEAVDCLPKEGLWLNVHCKDNVCDEVARKLKAKGRLHQAFVASDPKGVRAARKAVPEVKTCLMTGPWGRVWTDRMTSDYVADAVTNRYNFAQPHCCALRPEDAKRFHGAGGKFTFFRLTDPEKLPGLFSTGVDFPLVDDLDTMLAAYAAWEKAGCPKAAYVPDTVYDGDVVSGNDWSDLQVRPNLTTEAKTSGNEVKDDNR